MEISCAFPPVPETPDHVALAEELGYVRAWVYDTPALQLDCWMTLALAAVRTSRIELGPGVLIPSLRHPLVTAAAVATLVGLAPGRVVLGIGTGFTGRRAMGQKPLRWADMGDVVGTLRALLRGETVDVEGQPVRMLHWEGQAPARPIEVPVMLGVNGPKGQATAASLGCGVLISRPRPGAGFDDVPSATLLAFGTVLEPGESPGDPRVLDAAGPGAAVAYHAFLEQADARLDTLPNSGRFLELARALPERERHLHLHEGHLTRLNAIDRQVLVGEVVERVTLTGTAEQVRERVDALAGQGITEIAFQPMGDDIPRELRAFAAAARLPAAR
ncbi:MAG: LLM class flavin-dependent oxidoreductase [Acidimicrobiia bacterium]|nr:LLM class flavin-dependent oxidoreductase [Acidimicrobiia bacterium]